jgi:starch phosphorylase
VELYSGSLNADGDIVNPVITEMTPGNQDKDGYLCQTMMTPCCGSGRHGYTARVLPRHPELRSRFSPGLITWADGMQEPQSPESPGGAPDAKNENKGR